MAKINLENLHRLKILRLTVILGFLGGIFFSRELWFPVIRTFPRAPLFFFLPDEIIIFTERLLTSILVTALILSGLGSRMKIFSVVTIVSLLLLILFDQTRLQPWVYQYSLILVVFVFWNHQTENDEEHSESTIGLLQIILAGLYFWSGVQKLNYTFIHETINYLLAPLGNILPSFFPAPIFLGIGLAVMESLIGIGLFFRRTRNLSVAAAIIMHLVILSLLIARNHNSIVWIWNAALIPVIFMAFWNSRIFIKEIFTERTVAGWKSYAAKTIVIVSFLLPILSFWNRWDLYLSGALYSGNTSWGTIIINREWSEKLSPIARKTLSPAGHEGLNYLPLHGWALAEMNVPAYPEPRVYKQILHEVCRLTDDQTGIELIIRQSPSILDGSSSTTRMGCQDSVTRLGKQK